MSCSNCFEGMCMGKCRGEAIDEAYDTMIDDARGVPNE